MKPEEFWEEALRRKGLKRREVPDTETYWNGKSLDLLIPENSLILGEVLQGYFQAFVAPQDLKTHVGIVGPTGGGKSKLLEHIFRQLASKEDRPAIVLMDPKGDLYRDALGYCAEKELDNIILINPNLTSKSIAYNPMDSQGLPIDCRTNAKVLATLKAWNQWGTQETPRLRRWLTNTYRPLMEQGLTLCEALYMVDLGGNPIRQAIVARMEEGQIKREWQTYERFSLRERQEQIESTLSRLRAFLDNRQIASILTQGRRALQLRALLNQGVIILVNLEPFHRLSVEDANLLGTLLIDDLIAATFARPPDQRRPVVLIIDEAHRFVTPDIGDILDMGRGMNLHCILALQHLAQVREEDYKTYSALLTNARVKIIFGGLTNADLEILNPEFYTGELDLKEIKQELYRTFFEPVEETREIVTYSEMETEGDIQGTVGGTSFIPGQGLFDEGQTTFHESSSEITSRGSGLGFSRSIVPWHRLVKRKELSSREFYSLEEQLYKKMAELKGMPKQHAALKVPGEPVRIFKVTTVEEVDISEHHLTEYQDQILELPYYSTPEEIEQEEQERLKALEAEAQAQIEPSRRRRKKPK